MARYNSVFLSGLPGSGKSTLANAMAGEYHWKTTSIGDLWRARWRERYPLGQVTFEDYWASTTVSDNEAINREARELAQKGRIIIDGRFPIGFGPETLLVFVYAPLAVRAERAHATQKYSNASIEETKATLLKREDDEVKLGKMLFNIDYRSREFYAVVLDTSELSVAKELSKVKELLDS